MIFPTFWLRPLSLPRSCVVLYAALHVKGSGLVPAAQRAVPRPRFGLEAVKQHILHYTTQDNLQPRPGPESHIAHQMH